MATESQKRARNKYNSKNQVTKTIAFYRNTEKELVEHIENLDVSFSVYVKELIREDIVKNKEKE